MKHLKLNLKSLEFDWEVILKDIDLTLNRTDKISIVWSNWAWKTTLLKVLTWEIKNFTWSLDNIWNLTLWYLHQIYSDDENKLVREEFKDWFKDIIIKEKEIEKAEEIMNKNPNNIKLIEEYTSLLEQFNNIGWHDYNNKIHSTIL